MAPLDIKQKIALAELNLQRKLEWTSRYDTRIIFVAGTSVAMLGVLASAAGNITCWSIWSYLAFGASLVLLGLSLGCVFFSQKPKINSPNKSLIYFGTISKTKIANFIAEFNASTEEEYLDDLLHQIHINSRILSAKFFCLKLALGFIVGAILSWFIAIYLSKIYMH